MCTLCALDPSIWTQRFAQIPKPTQPTHSQAFLQRAVAKERQQRNAAAEASMKAGGWRAAC